MGEGEDFDILMAPTPGPGFHAIDLCNCEPSVRMSVFCRETLNIHPFIYVVKKYSWQSCSKLNLHWFFLQLHFIKQFLCCERLILVNKINKKIFDVKFIVSRCVVGGGPTCSSKNMKNAGLPA
jgi:hypothetical protein